MSARDDYEKALNERLDALMQGKASVPMAPAPQDKYDAMAKALEQHASANIYGGPPVQGDYYAGWPVSELLGSMVPKSVHAHVHAALRRRNRQIMGNASYGGGGGGGGGGVVGGVLSQTVMSRRQHSLEEMMAMRMRWGPLQEGMVVPWAVGFAHMAMHAVGDTVHIWIITKDGKDVVLEDEHGLYPSDGLITKIRLLQRGE